MKKFLSNYLRHISENGNPALSEAVNKTVNDIVPKYVANFSYKEHVVSLLVGDVQSGKTSHMFGVICAAADEGFGIFVLLTTDNVILQQQTYKRAQTDLSDFCICDENDYIKFQENNMRLPAVIVLKKNGRILRQWKNNFASTKFVAGNPLFIVDDEGDAASLNTQVNRNRQSTINRCLDEIKRTTSSSIYLQVTGTPQSILLQSKKSGWKPYFIYYFKPGKGYIGGNFFFNGENKTHVVLTDNTEASELLDDDEFPQNGLKTALIMHLISSAHIMLNGGDVCNFLIHPSVKTSEHSKFAEKVGNYLNELWLSFYEDETIATIRAVYDSLRSTKPDIADFDAILSFIWDEMQNDRINILILNSVVPFEENTRYEKGNNIIIGGNSLARGVTFPKLQTIYYCRVSKNPQADTMWQHARMFGYDRDPGLLRVFMPPELYKLFSDINTTNNNIISQIESSDNGCDIKIFYPTGLRPTRKNVLDNKIVGVYSGRVNYFPFYPINTDIKAIDDLLAPFSDEVYSVSMRLIIKLLSYMGSEGNDWNIKAFIGFINTFIADNPLSQAKLIVRRERDIGRGTGTLLSPNDRMLGDSFPNDLVFTVYKVTGTKGWDGKKLWIPNIKLPGNIIYYSGDFITT
jgi:hypothetical protein